jgi:uncharacterized membrane protein
MKLWLTNKLEDLRDSFWFLPTLMVIGAIGLSLTMIRLDQATADQTWVTSLSWTFSRGPEGSRAVLSTVAASMMTIASVTFSITIVALQLASTQFGPRLLRNFMRDRGNQVAIGTFIATFTYCLLVLRTVNGTDAEPFVPHLSVTVGLLLALASLGVLIYFVHHAAESIQAENVIGEVSRELQRAIDKLYPDRLGENPRARASDCRNGNSANHIDGEAKPISSPTSNYLQSIDADRLLELAQQHDLVLIVHQRPGKFCFRGGSLLEARPLERVDGSTVKVLQKCFYFGSRRTLAQDIEYAIDQLVEVAVRALSPGVNDPFTAVNCVDRLGAALCVLAEREFPSRFRVDEHGTLRVVTDTSTASGLIDACFDQIRQAAEGNISLSIRLLETIAEVARHTEDEQFHSSLEEQAEAVFRGSQRAAIDAADQHDIDAQYSLVKKAIAISKRAASETAVPADFASSTS